MDTVSKHTGVTNIEDRADWMTNDEYHAHSSLGSTTMGYAKSNRSLQ